jgi:signal transduction histidine kinase/ActR/RegA family two-component response regulator
MAALAIAYFLSARLGLSLAPTFKQVSPVWPPTGVALAALLLFGRRYWPAVAAGAFAANILAGEPILTALVIAGGNTLEALAGAWLLQRAGFDPSLGRLKDVVTLVLLGAILSTALSATVGATSLCSTMPDLHPWSAYGSRWCLWWLGDAMGALVVAPFLLAWISRPRVVFRRTRLLEVAVLFSALILGTATVFIARWLPGVDRYSLAYFVFPFSIWGAIRFGQKGNVLVTFFASSVAIVGTVHGWGPFIRGRIEEDLVQLQVFLSVVAITGLVLAAAMTERRKAEKERAELLVREQASRRESEHANLMKDQFLATLSHELRTPLNAILGWTHLIRAGKLEPGEAEQGIEVIERNAQNQAQIIRDLLDMSRIISGKLSLEVQEVELAPILLAALDAVRPAADAKVILIQLRLEPRPLVIAGDPTRLQQVTWNLLSNAIKFTPRGGRVLVELSRVESDAEIAISDTGVGIDPEFLPHAFERFRQADASTTRRFGGLGLGLAIVRNLVESHGGAVRAESEGEGKGATFRVHLPLSAKRPDRPREHGTAGTEPAPPPAAVGPGVSLRGIKVLVVDDEADSREVLRKTLEEHHADVATAGGAAEAMEALKSRRPDILISDIRMPGEDGYSFLGRVRQLEPDLPAVALTAIAGREEQIRAMEAGFLVHVEKPVNGEELVAILARLTGRRSGRPITNHG